MPETLSFTIPSHHKPAGVDATLLFGQPVAMGEECPGGDVITVMNPGQIARLVEQRVVRIVCPKPDCGAPLEIKLANI